MLGIIDIIIIGLVALLFLMGLVKGFVKQLSSIGAWILAAVVPIAVSKPVSTMVVNMGAEDTFATNALVFVGLFVVTFVIVKIIGHSLSKSVQKGALGGVDRLIGGVWGIAKALLIVCLVFILVQWVITLPLIGSSVNTFVSEQLDLANPEFGIARYLYKTNPLSMLLKLLTDNLPSF
ncbi:MAG: CvpA family protein [Bacilli bacterium]|jgi:membrane protein required for colicin V production|nr:CvpA family protein [Bacilli bacterium]MDY0063493.1 CvpA family protein [Bacilli bacterium]